MTRPTKEKRGLEHVLHYVCILIFSCMWRNTKTGVWLYNVFRVLSPLSYFVNLPNTTTLEQILLRDDHIRSGEQDNGATEVAAGATPTRVKFVAERTYKHIVNMYPWLDAYKGGCTPSPPEFKPKV